MRVTVISPEAAVYDGEAEAVTAPAFDGEIGILPNHAALMTTLGRGTLRGADRRHGAALHCARGVPAGRQEQGPRSCRTCRGSRLMNRHLVRTIAALLVAAPLAAQSTGTPVYHAPYRAFATSEVALSLSDPGAGFALEGSYRTGISTKSDLGLRAGLNDARPFHGAAARRRRPGPAARSQRVVPARRVADHRPRHRQRRRLHTSATCRSASRWVGGCWSRDRRSRWCPTSSRS